MKLEVNGLEQGYGSSTILRDVSFSAESGEVVTVLGPNGSGTPAGEFSRTFSDYGDVTIALNNGKMTVEGLANATGTVYFPDLEYESGGTRYRASFVFYIVSDLSPADSLFTLIRETKTISLSS